MVNRDDSLDQRIKKLRKEYQNNFELDQNSVNRDPFEQFSEWFEMALRADLIEPNAMALATVGNDQQPSVRMILLKQCSKEGFVFYTNYQSRKGLQLAENASAALLFFWAALERQVRIEGQVSRVPRADSQRYFEGRPRGSQLGAAASPQSQIIQGRETLEATRTKLDQDFAQTSIPCPQHWGGYILRPERFEFWQGRENRLHDRIEYQKRATGWTINRLAP